MLTKLTNEKIVTGICLPKSLKETIDTRRGDIPRSKYISRILERQIEHENEIVIPHLFHPQHIWESMLQMDKDNYTSDISKDSSPATICYSKMCNNLATAIVRIPFNVTLCCVVHVCDKCLSKYQVHNDTYVEDMSVSSI
jgi:hypothetical protein